MVPASPHLTAASDRQHNCYNTTLSQRDVVKDLFCEAEDVRFVVLDELPNQCPLKVGAVLVFDWLRMSLPDSAGLFLDRL